MESKDPEGMTASELLRWAANGGYDAHWNSIPSSKLMAALAGKNYDETTVREDRKALGNFADRIDAELAQARREGLRQSTRPLKWVRRAIEAGEDWPEPREGESFRDYLERCFLPRPRFEDGEPMQIREKCECGGHTWTIDGFDGDEVLLGRCLDDDAETTVTRWENPVNIKRPAPDELGADGLPIKVGETVWLDDEHAHWAGFVILGSGDRGGLAGVDPHEALRVRYVSSPRSGMVCFASATSAWCPASWLTHTPPDAKERLLGDRRKPVRAHCGCEDSECRECPQQIAGARPSERCGAGSCAGAQGAGPGRPKVALCFRGGARCGDGSHSCNRCGHLRRDEGLGTVWFSQGRHALFCAHPEEAARRIAATGLPHRFIGWSRPGGGLDAKTVPVWCPLRGRR